MTLGLEDLIRLIDDLRLAGYDIGTQQYINAQRLLIALAAHGRHPANVSELSTLLAPVFCSSPKEQENFYEHFQQWLARQPLLRQPVESGEQDTVAGDDRSAAKSSLARKLFRLRPKSLLAIAALILLATLLAALYYASRQPGADPVSGEAVTKSEAIKFPALPTPLPGPDPAQKSAAPQKPKTSPSVTATQEPTQTQTPPPSPPPTPTASPLITSSPPPMSFKPLRLASLILPLFCFMGWCAWRWYRRRRMLLQKMRSPQPPRLEHLTVKGVAGQLFQGQHFRRTMQELRRHRRKGSRDLDTPVTIEATIRRGGLFSPFYGSRRTLPEYLVLIDRLSAGDQQARFEEELIKRLAQDNIFIDQYYFRSDPRICRLRYEDATRAARYITLQDLAALHPEHYLLIFSDGASFINPVTGQLEMWLELFSPWTGRALLTPDPPAHWRYREWALQASDFLVLPADSDGLAALGEAVNASAPHNFQQRLNKRQHPFPETLQDRPNRWLEDHKPPPEKAGKLFAELAALMGEDGMNWLRACAVYPALHWDLTLYLGFELVENREEFERKLLALVSLPWFRYGTMPDWLRAELVADLPPEREDVVRRALENLLASMLDPPPDGIRLDFSRSREESPEKRSFIDRLKERLRERKRKKMLRELFRTEEKGSPLQDFVFLSFMSGQQPRPLDVTVPDVLRNILFPHGQRALGLRPVTLLLAAFLVSFIGWTAASALEPQLGNYAFNAPSWFPRGLSEGSPSPVTTPSPGASPSAKPAVTPVVKPPCASFRTYSEAAIAEGKTAEFEAVLDVYNGESLGYDWVVKDDLGNKVDFDEVPFSNITRIEVKTRGLGGRTITATVSINVSDGRAGITIPNCRVISETMTTFVESNSSRHAVVRDKIITISAAKKLLQEEGFYKGPIDDNDDDAFIEAIRQFQKSQGMNADGLLGLSTLKPLLVQSGITTPSPTPTPSPSPSPTPELKLTSVDVIFTTQGNGKDRGDTVHLEIRWNGATIGNQSVGANQEWKNGNTQTFTIQLNRALNVSECKDLSLNVRLQNKAGERHQWDFQVRVMGGLSNGDSLRLLPTHPTTKLGEEYPYADTFQLRCP